jgi:putative ABC transport system substrate-binding protein
MGDLVRRQVAAIVATPTTAALAAKAGTSTVPIVFVSTDDPVNAGLVASLARPGGNVTGVYFFLSDLGAKQLGLLRELLPSAVRIAHLINPGNPNVAFATKDVIAAASTLGVEVMPVEAGDVPGIEIAFKSLVAKKAEGLVVAADPLFFSRRLQLATLATRHGIPAIYNVREFAEAGGLMSYGTSLADAFRQAATYVTRILKGEKPTDLPVVQATKFELAINLPTARALGVDVPPTLLARADEVIE